MDKNSIVSLIKQTVAGLQSSARFQLSPNNRHVHNNVDAPFVFLPYTLYGGFVPYDPTITSLESILPKGWTLRHDATGFYALVHNLGTSLYTCVVTATQSTNMVVSAVVSSFENEVEIGWFDSSSSPQDTSFNFILMEVTNSNASFPTYSVKNVR